VWARAREDKWFDLFNLLFYFGGERNHLIVSDLDFESESESESKAEISVSRFPLSSRPSTGIQRLPGAQMFYPKVPNPASSRPRIIAKQHRAQLSITLKN